jgi:hypothetical protein
MSAAALRNVAPTPSAEPNLGRLDPLAHQQPLVEREAEIRQSRTHRPTIENEQFQEKQELYRNESYQKKKKDIFDKSQDQEESKQEEISYISKLQNSLVFIPGQDGEMDDKLLTSEDMICMQKSEPAPLSMSSVDRKEKKK